MIVMYLHCGPCDSVPPLPSQIVLFYVVKIPDPPTKYSELELGGGGGERGTRKALAFK